MKKALKILSFYILGFLFMLTAGTLFYLAYLHVINYSAGMPVPVFGKEVVFKAFFYIGACSCILFCPFVAVFRIRHKGGIPQLLVYILLSVVLWGILFPFFLGRVNQSGFDNALLEKKVSSSGYFRSADGQIYFFTKDLEENGMPVNALVITPENQDAVEVKEVQAKSDFILFEQAEPYNDVFTKEVFKNAKIGNIFYFRMILDQATQALQESWSFWLFFLSFALALVSVYGLSNFFDWKLLNSIFVLIVSFLILICNTMYFSPAFEVYKMNHLQNGLFTSLAKVMNNPPLVLLNLLFSFITITTGTVVYFVKKRRVEE